MTISFDLRMSKGAHDIFGLVINFLGFDWQPKHVTIGLFEAIKTNGQALANNLTKLFDQSNILIQQVYLFVNQSVTVTPDGQ